MADIYGVTAADVAAELPGLFPMGFTQATKPTVATVVGWITDADTLIDTVVTQVTAVNADLAESASRLARRYIIDEVILRVSRAVYAGKASPQDIAAMVTGLGGKTVLDQINALATSEIAAQLAKLQEAEITSPRVAVSGTTPARDLLISDVDLDPHFGGGRF